MISKEKIEKINSFKNDDSDLITKILEYLNHKHTYINKDAIYKHFDDVINEMKDVENSVIYVFSDNKTLDNNFVSIKKDDFDSVINEKTTEIYYAGEKYETKLKKYKEIAMQYQKYVEGKEKAIFILDISSISSFPLWNTMMRRKMMGIMNKIQEIEFEQLTPITLHRIIKNTELVKFNEKEKYDIDAVISVIKAISAKMPLEFYFINEEEENEKIYLVNELKKLVYAITLDKIGRYDYIYDTVCKDMDEMFSVYGFCNFKENKCVSQRHKTLFNRYPVPKTDGCCFKVVRKCEHNNKDGTCKVKCLPCKLFTCPYLGKISIGIRTSELILLKTFFNNRQKRTSLYKFYNSKEVLLKKIINEE